MSNFDDVDFFNDESLVEDPYPYFEHLRSKCPITDIGQMGVLAVSGYDEASEIYRNTDVFSSCNSVVGPYAMFPVPLEGDDITPIIDEYRDQLPMHEHMVTMDPPDHTNERALLMRLLTPRRLKENEEFMWGLADRQIDEFIGDGKCEFIRAYTQPFAMLAVADVLGVPVEDHEELRRFFGLMSGTPGSNYQGAAAEAAAEMELNPLEALDKKFITYLEDRRLEPQGDVLTDLALGKYPDGSTPDVINVVRSATFLFAAGQETTARLLAAGIKYLAENPDVQDELRNNRDLIADFVEETLRIESPVKADFRLAKKAVTVGGVEIAPGTPVMLLNGAANRDPKRFECPAEFRIDRPTNREHLAFGRGHHSCPGGPLARAEGRISFNRILDRMKDIRLDEEFHGPKGERRFEYEPTWILRGLRNLHITYTPA